MWYNIDTRKAPETPEKRAERDVMIKEDIRIIRGAKKPPKITPFWEQFWTKDGWKSEATIQQNVDAEDIARAAHIIKARGE